VTEKRQIFSLQKFTFVPSARQLYLFNIFLIFAKTLEKQDVAGSPYISSSLGFC